MSGSLRRTFSRILAVGVLLMLAPGHSYSQDAKEQEANKSTAEKQAADFEGVRQKLQKRADFEFVETPLKDVVDYVSDVIQVPIDFDLSALEEEGVSPDTPITFALRGATAAVAFRRALARVNPNVDMAIRDGFVLVSTKSKLDEIYETRVYCFDQLPRLSTVGLPGTEYGGGEALGYPGGPPPSNEMRAQKFREVLAVVEPMSWQENGGAARMAMINGHLVIWQTARIHEQIADLLEDLREAGDPDRPMPVEGMMGPGGTGMMPGGGAPPGVPSSARRRPLPRPAGPSTLENQ